MRKIYAFLALTFLLACNVKGQYVTIPDVYFRAWLNNNGLSGCITGTQMDTTCPAVVEFDTISIGTSLGITNLSGMEYFRKLRYLKFKSNNVTAIPALCDSLRYISLGNMNSIASIPNVPPLVEVLDIQLPISTINIPSSVKHLYLNSTHITSLPPLPSTLLTLDCRTPAGSSYIIPSLPNPLPSSLETLNWMGNPVAALPNLPSGLRVLLIYQAGLTSISSFPNSLMDINVQRNNLTALPPLPLNLITLICSYNAITAIPASNCPSLTNLFCDSNQLTSLNLNNFPSLQNLYADNNHLTNISTFPPQLRVIDCSFNNLTQLPNIANISSLQRIICSNNQLASFPVIPYQSIDYIDCSHNSLTNVDFLWDGSFQTPVSLTTLNISHNNIDVLSSAVSPKYYIEKFNCSYNPNLKEFGFNLNGVAEQFDCSFTDMRDYAFNLNSYPPYYTELPYSQFSPSTIINLNGCQNLTCMPRIDGSLNTLLFGLTGIQCLGAPISANNSSPLLSTIPYCDYLFNPNNCPFNNITGKVFNDLNGNCNIDVAEVFHPDIKVQLYSGSTLVQQAYSVDNGDFGFNAPAGNYTLKIDTAGFPIYPNCYASGYSINANPSNYTDLPYKCKPGFNLSVQSLVHTAGITFPGTGSIFKLIAGDAGNLHPGNSINAYNICPAGVPAEVRVVLSGPADFAPNITPVPTYINGDTIAWQVANISSFTFPLIRITTDTLALIGQNICFNVSVTTSTPGDNNASDNVGSYCFPVVNSYDPNEKEVSPKRSMAAGEWLTYTIHFQNMGTAQAMNIRIRDTLSSNLDVSTFQLLDYSHNCITQLLEGGIAQFMFPNINLPDSASNPEGSKGYVQFRIKIKPGLSTGFTISNKASIYFDYNPPVVTNMVVSRNCTAPAVIQNTSALTCIGNSVYFAGNYLTNSGTYRDTIRSYGGCDSIIRVLNLSIVNNFSSTINQSICNGSVYSFNGVNLTISGAYYDTLQTAIGCDSIIALNLTVNNTSTYSLNQTICSNEVYNFNGVDLNASGTYLDTLQNAVGCDSIITLTLIDGGSPTLTTQATICDGDTYNFGGQALTQQGTYTYSSTNVNGCDSQSVVQLQVTKIILTNVVINNLEELTPGSIDMTITGGVAPLSYSWSNGDTLQDIQVYETGILVVTVTDASGCSNSFSFDVAGIPWGIDDVRSSINFTLLPNPANNMVSVILAGATPAQLKLYNTIGEVVLQHTTTQANTPINISGLPAGIYFVQVETEKGTAVKRLVVAR
jgi:uncharacterized repeat protein (TIGR01451 family)